MLLSFQRYYRSATSGSSSQLLDSEDEGNMALRNVRHCLCNNSATSKTCVFVLSKF